MHVHVQTADGEAKFWLEPRVELANNYGLSERQVKSARQLVEDHESEIRKSWKAHSVVEVTNISPHGFWLFLAGREHFVSFELFPWFRDASVAQLCDVQLPSAHHLYWPQLDVDLAVESLTHPEKFPLVSTSPRYAT